MKIKINLHKYSIITIIYLLSTSSVVYYQFSLYSTHLKNGEIVITDNAFIETPNKKMITLYITSKGMPVEIIKILINNTYPNFSLKEKYVVPSEVNNVLIDYEWILGEKYVVTIYTSVSHNIFLLKCNKSDLSRGNMKPYIGTEYYEHVYNLYNVKLNSSYNITVPNGWNLINYDVKLINLSYNISPQNINLKINNSEYYETISLYGENSTFISLNECNFDDGDKFVLEAFIYKEKNAYMEVIDQRINKRSNKGFVMSITKYGRVSFLLGNGSTTFLIQTPTLTILNNAWTHIVCMYDANGLSIYKNGKMIVKKNCYINKIKYDDSKLNIGSNFVGMIDEIRLYNRTFTDQEIMEHYKNIHNDDKNLMLYYDCNSFDGNVMLDMSKHNNSALIMNVKNEVGVRNNKQVNNIDGLFKLNFTATKNYNGSFIIKTIISREFLTIENYYWDINKNGYIIKITHILNDEKKYTFKKIVIPLNVNYKLKNVTLPDGNIYENYSKYFTKEDDNLTIFLNQTGYWIWFWTAQ
jgi:hypothetical protein